MIFIVRPLEMTGYDANRLKLHALMTISYPTLHTSMSASFSNGGSRHAAKFTKESCSLKTNFNK